MAPVQDHDGIVERMRALLITRGYKVRINPGSEKRYGVTGPSFESGQKVTYYPDVYTYDEGTKNVMNIYEVETSASINESEADQWRLYSNGSAKLYLVVPTTDVERTKELVQRKKISIAGYYNY